MIKNGKVVFHIANLAGGGAERVAVEIARHFVARGTAVIFFVHASSSAYVLPEGVEIIVASSAGHLGRVLEFRRLLTRVKPDAVLSFLPYANLISLFAQFFEIKKIRLVISEHLTIEGEHNARLMEKIKWKLRRYLYQRSDSIIAVSKGVAEDLKQTLAGPVSKKISVIYNPCFIPNAKSKIIESTRREKNILAVGRLCDDKGFDILIRAFARIDPRIGDVKLIIAGEGPRRSDLEKLILDLGLSNHVSLPGFRPDVRDLYEQADLFVCSSRREGFGNVIVEALSFGLRVVATRCPHGPEEILDSGRFGRLVAVGDELELAEAMAESLHSAKNEAAQVSRAGDFSLDFIGDRYLEAVGLSTSHRKEASTQSAGYSR
ncbi:glycosyltransferase [Paraburkholderia acidisoli]|uniref:Glycosyltransferase n=1 Tax=Paraburkholderia acidisoli TaxID=2571748 RepID=A0A7Z2GI89_9BURK|nr:glycosyltransferase [Paraburkholderia acidisoli]QGZ62311.1 glycosyltransferase [Paraburkholderia acidisoli]